jgi:hypothetical protein
MEHLGERGTPMRTLRTGVRTVAAAIVVVLLLTVPAIGATGVLTTKAYEFNPAATDTYISWNGISNRHYVVYAKPFGGSRFRVNPKGTNAWNGSIDGTTLIYQVYVHSKDRSDVYSHDLVTKTRTKIGKPVSTDRWEYDPVGSGDWVMYARYFRNADRKIYLYNTNTHELRTLASTSGRAWSLTPSQVNGNYAVWEKAKYRHSNTLGCDVFLYDIAGGTKTKLANPNDRCQYSPGVNPAGTVFFARSGLGCGKNVVLREQALAGSATTVGTIRAGHDVTSLYAVDHGDTTTDLYYDPVSCTKPRADVVRVNLP